ncbi:MAG: ligase [Rhodoferax sp.]
MVLGCSQRALRAAAQPRLPPGLALLDRPSGGGAVLIGPWLVSVSVVLPHGHAWARGGLVDSYRQLGLLHADVLAGLGVTAQALPPAAVAPANARMGPTVGWACYGSLAPWELVDAQGRKLVGLAQRRQRTGILLVAGTLVSAPPWSLLCEAMGNPQDTPVLQHRTVSCDALAASPCTPQALAAALQQALEDGLAAAG